MIYTASNELADLYQSILQCVSLADFQTVQKTVKMLGSLPPAATPEPVAPTPSPDIAGLVERLRAGKAVTPGHEVVWVQNLMAFIETEMFRTFPGWRTIFAEEVTKLLAAANEAAAALQRVAQERDAANAEIARLQAIVGKDPNPVMIAFEDGAHQRSSRAAGDAIRRAEAAEARIASARDEGLEMALEPFAADRRHSLGYHGPVYGDDDPEPTHNKWVIWREEGNINDREWVVVASGDTPAAAILALKGTKP